MTSCLVLLLKVQKKNLHGYLVDSALSAPSGYLSQRERQVLGSPVLGLPSLAPPSLASRPWLPVLGSPSLAPRPWLP